MAKSSTIVNCEQADSVSVDDHIMACVRRWARECTSNLTTAANEFVGSGLQPRKARYGSRGTTMPVLAIEALSATVVLYTHLTSRLKPVVLQNVWSCRRWEHGEAACGAGAGSSWVVRRRRTRSSSKQGRQVAGDVGSHVTSGSTDGAAG